MHWKQLLLLSTSLLTLASCLPQRPPAAAEDTDSRGRRAPAAAANSAASGRRTRPVQAQAAPDTAATNSDSLNIARLAAQAMAAKARPQSRRQATGGDSPFASRQAQLEDVTDESQRFIDTTYYMLKMEAGAVEITSDMPSTTPKTQADFEELIRNYINAQATAEAAGTIDCGTFRAYVGQFGFNDSLLQEATYSLAECLVSAGDLTAAAAAFEQLCASRMNRTVAPKALVRLGQVYCLLGDNSAAKRQFNRLKKEFPKSVYNQLADCGRL